MTMRSGPVALGVQKLRHMFEFIDTLAAHVGTFNQIAQITRSPYRLRNTLLAGLARGCPGFSI